MKPFVADVHTHSLLSGHAFGTVRELAAEAAAQTVPVEESLGRILASPTVGCPPAVPVVACGERIDEGALACFRYYGIKTCTVVCEPEEMIGDLR